MGRGTRLAALLPLLALGALAATLGGCAGPATRPASASPDVAGSTSPRVPAAASPAVAEKWTRVPLVNVRNGSRFQIADFKGRVVFVETMAVWCGNCRSQQELSKRALGALPDDVAYIVLDVEQAESPEQLARYANENGFPFIYAIAPPELSRALARDFGDQVLNPVTTPIVVISREGRATRARDGFKSVDELVELARDHGA